MALTLKQWRLAKEISIQDMAKAVGVSHVTYSNMEKEPDTFTIGVAKKAVEYLEIDMEDVIFFADESTKSIPEVSEV
ncbi:MAG: helix-turn-helix transcriptional regulator [Pseudobutyrivibrio sp.]|mgnify:CR=1 FL=1|nr:helix-turn-helix transcriptional regulator [Pseudobutyrivibrio sp.]